MSLEVAKLYARKALEGNVIKRLAEAIIHVSEGNYSIAKGTLTNALNILEELLEK